MCSYYAEKALPGLNSGMNCWRNKYHYKNHRFNTTMQLSLHHQDALVWFRDCLSDKEPNLMIEEKAAGDAEKALSFATECMLQLSKRAQRPRPHSHLGVWSS